MILVMYFVACSCQDFYFSYKIKLQNPEIQILVVIYFTKTSGFALREDRGFFVPAITNQYQIYIFSVLQAAKKLIMSSIHNYYCCC